jgi:hypothetical protein
MKFLFYKLPKITTIAYIIKGLFVWSRIFLVFDFVDNPPPVLGL